jgi:hypothetical protein
LVLRLIEGSAGPDEEAAVFAALSMRRHAVQGSIAKYLLVKREL